MNDLVERLRDGTGKGTLTPVGELHKEAADEIERLRHCIRGLTDQNAALIWELKGHGNNEPMPDIFVQNAALTGENMILKSELAAVKQECAALRQLAESKMDEVERLREEIASCTADLDREVSEGNRYMLEAAGLREQLTAVTKERDALLKGCKVFIPTITMEQALATEYRRGYQAAIDAAMKEQV